MFNINLIRTYLSQLDRNRKVMEMDTNGQSVSEISEALGIPEQLVNGVLNVVKAQPIMLEKSPSEVINRGLIGEISHEEMITELSNWEYTFDATLHLNPNGNTSGTWKQVSDAFVEGRLSEEDYTTLLNVVYSKQAETE